MGDVDLVFDAVVQSGDHVAEAAVGHDLTDIDLRVDRDADDTHAGVRPGDDARRVRTGAHRVVGPALFRAAYEIGPGAHALFEIGVFGGDTRTDDRDLDPEGTERGRQPVQPHGLLAPAVLLSLFQPRVDLGQRGQGDQVLPGHRQVRAMDPAVRVSTRGPDVQGLNGLGGLRGQHDGDRPVGPGEALARP